MDLLSAAMPAPPPPSVHLSGLNGLRAISALAVVVSHISLSLDKFGLDRYLFGRFADGTARGLDMASYGVTIFFTISGFLITYLLLAERNKTGTVHVGRFYVRRVLRIWPLYYGYLFMALGVATWAGMEWNSGSLAYYLLLLSNIPFMFGGEIPLIEHFWTIGVEEQFYLFWPWLVKWARERLLRLVVVLLSLLILSLFLAKYLSLAQGIRTPLVLLGTVRFQCMLVGCLGAILWSSGNVWFAQVTTHVVAQFSAWGAVLLIALNQFPVPSFVANEAVSVIALLLIMGQVTGARRTLGLENHVCDVLGRMSYGIYILHPLVIYLFARWIDVSGVAVPLRYPLVFGAMIALTLSFAWLSYRYFETPILRMKARFAVVQSRSGMNGMT